MACLESENDIIALVTDNRAMIRVLEAVSSLGLPDGWIGAGFLRNAIWDQLHGYVEPTPLDDIDVIYHDPDNSDPAIDKNFEARLMEILPGEPWSVKNQARMHLKNGDPPYHSTAEALCHWLETPTAVAVRLNVEGNISLLAPFGAGDLLGLVVRPTPHARKHRLAAYRNRMELKNWPSIWPRVRVLWE
jgi:hypothetical protein